MGFTLIELQSDASFLTQLYNVVMLLSCLDPGDDKDESGGNKCNKSTHKENTQGKDC